MKNIFFLLMILGLSISCGFGKTKEPVLAETPVISGGLGWGIISIAYMPIKEQNSSSSQTIGTARHGELVKIIAIDRSFTGTDTGVWYKVELPSVSGWVHESSLKIYKTEAEVKEAMKGLQ